MNIELYSVRGFTGNALRQKLAKALEAHHMQFDINEINHVDQFIKAGLASVPAFKIGPKVIQHPHDGDVDETVQKVVDFLLAQSTKDILVPVDFSDESYHAIRYARMMALELGYGLTLAHVHQTLYDPVSAGALDVQLLQDSNKRLMELVDTYNAEHLAQNINIPVSAHLEVGEASNTLVELLNSGPFELMIMATRAVDNTVRRIFGSVSSEVSRHSNKPVIVVPPQSEVVFPGKWIVGFNEELMQEGMLEYILSFAISHNVFLEFVHVTEDSDYFNQLKHQLLEKIGSQPQLEGRITISSLKGESLKIDEILFKHAIDAKSGLVVLISHHRNFLESITHASVTRRALHHPLVPLMIVHHEG